MVTAGSDWDLRGLVDYLEPRRFTILFGAIM